MGSGGKVSCHLQAAQPGARTTPLITHCAPELRLRFILHFAIGPLSSFASEAVPADTPQMKPPATLSKDPLPPAAPFSPAGRFEVAMREGGSLLTLAGPIIISQLGGIGMNVMDTVMIGRLGAESLAALAIANGLHMFTLILCMGTLLGMSPLVSQAFGAGNRRECRRVLVQGLWLAAVLALPVTLFSFFGYPVAVVLGQPDSVAVLAGGYLAAVAAGVLPFLLFTAFRQFLEGMNLTRPAMVITFIGLGVNYWGNRLLIYGAGGWLEPMGVVGSGWSTTIVRWAMLGAMLLYAVWNPRLHPFRGVRRRLERDLFRRIAVIGLPAGLQLGLEMGFFAACAVMMGWFGALELGTHQITLNIAASTFMVALGLSIAGSIRVGQRLGAGDQAGVRGATLATYALATGSMAVFAILFLVVPRTLLGFYTDDPQILALGAALLGMAALFQIFDGAQVAGICVLRGAADTRVPTVMAALAYWGIGVPAAYLLGFHSPLGPVGVWAGMAVALASASVLLLWRVRRVIWPLPAAV